MKFATLKQTFFIFSLLATTAVFLWMLGSYLYPVLWAAVIVVIFAPLYKKIERLFRGRGSIAALTTIGIICIMVALPLLVISTLVVQESTAIYQELRGNNTGESASLGGLLIIEQVSGLVSKIELIDIPAEKIEARLQSEFARFAEFLASSALSLGRTTIWFAIQVAITVYLLFFFFRDGSKLKDLLIRYVPLDRKDKERLLTRFATTSQAVVQGTLLIAIIQGTLGGLALWIAGVSAPVLWGVVITILAIIPAVGASLVWLPAALSLLIAGEIWQGLFLIGTGIFFVSIIDEFLRPILVGRRANMHDAVVLLATIGGIATFGISGFVVGPIIAALCLSLWIMFEEKYRTQLRRK